MPWNGRWSERWATSRSASNPWVYARFGATLETLGPRKGLEVRVEREGNGHW